jgi:hypothetical protein
MGIYMLFLLFTYFVGVTVLGLLVLAGVPAFHVTLGNIAVFFLGAVAATLAFFGIWDFLERTFMLYKDLPVSSEGATTVILAFLGALVGGTALVSVRMRFQGLPRRKQKP